MGFEYFIVFIIFYVTFETLFIRRIGKRQKRYFEYHVNRSYYLSRYYQRDAKDYDSEKMTYREALDWLLLDAKINCYNAFKNRELTPEELKKRDEYKYNIYLAETTIANMLREKQEGDSLWTI